MLCISRNTALWKMLIRLKKGLWSTCTLSLIRVELLKQCPSYAAAVLCIHRSRSALRQMELWRQSCLPKPLFFVPLINILREEKSIEMKLNGFTGFCLFILVIIWPFCWGFIILKHNSIWFPYRWNTNTDDNLKLSLLFLIRTPINHYSVIIIPTCFDKATTFMFQNELGLNLSKPRVLYVFWKCHEIFTAIYLHSANLPPEPYVSNLRLQLYETLKIVFIKSTPVVRSAYLHLF